MPDFSKYTQAIRETGCSGWLFYNFKHRDTLSDRLLGIPPDSVNTRRWFYLITAGGSGIKIVHSIEKQILDSLPGETLVYSAGNELHSCLSTALSRLDSGAGPVAAQYSEDFPAVSFLDYGTVRLLQETGFPLTSSAEIVSAVLGTLTEDEIASHERTAEQLYMIVENTWDRIRGQMGGTALYEKQVQDWILQEFRERDLITDHPPIIAAGRNASDPHYTPQGNGALLQTGEILQFDLWAKENSDDGIYADISWVGFLGAAVPEQMRKRFSALCTARDGAVQYIRDTENATGSAVDTYVTGCLTGQGFGSALRHRTGHSIDRECHGSGVNLDGREFPDQRQLREGACFSIEPGLYFEEYGMRTEIDVYIQNGVPVVSGGLPQQRILTLP